MKKKHIYILLLLILTLSSLTIDSNYAFQLTKSNAGDSVPLGPVEFESFSLAADTYQYVDFKQSNLYGTTAADPPAGMGADSVETTNMTEGSYSVEDEDTLETTYFSSLPAGWTATEFVISGGVATAEELTGQTLTTKNYDLSSYSGSRLTYLHRAYDTGNLYESSDWEIWYTVIASSKVADVAAADPLGDWKAGSHSVDSTAATFKWVLKTMGAQPAERIETDNWVIYGILELTYYRFEAVFRFDSVTQALASYALYIDFYPATPGADDLDFYIGVTTNPTNKIASDKQDDFSIDVTDYITSATIYIRISDTYRSGDTVQTTAYIARCYLYTPEEPVNWYSNDWIYRKQISVLEQSGAGTNYQIPINVYYNDSTKDVAGSIDCEALCQPDFDDIRFTASNGTTLLDHWLEFNVSTTYAKFWVEVKADTSSTASDVKIFTYFGNDAATNVSNGTATFLTYDDWAGQTIDTAIWDVVSSSGSVSYSLTNAQHGYVMKIDANAAANYHITTDYDACAPLAVMFRANIEATTTGNIARVGSGYAGAFGFSLVQSNAGTNTFYVYDDLGNQDSQAMVAGYFDAWTTFQITRSGTSAKLYAAYSLIETASFDPDAVSTNPAISIMCQDSEDDVYVDWVAARKFVATEPAFAAPTGLEYQDIYAPVMNAASFSPLNPTTATGITLFAIVTDADVVDMTSVYFDAIAYPVGFNDSNYYATEVGTNVWSYTFAEDELDAGVYCFVAHAIDVIHETTATYDLYQTFQIIQAEEDTITSYIVVFDTLGNFIPFETFAVYRNNARQYTYSFTCYDYEPQNITIEDRWGETLNTTEFDAGTIELVVVVEVYSLKFMSYYTDFAYFNLTRNAYTYTEVIAPLEIVDFRLFAGTYNYGINFRNGSGWCISGTINLVNSTAIIITGSGVSDLLGLISGTYSLATGLNVSVTTIATDTYTIQLMFDWTNTSLYGQTINILAAFNFDNTTLYNQTLSLLNAFNSTNTVLYSQIILLQNMFNWENTTLFNQTISILNAFNATNTVLYDQTVTILSNVSYYGSTIYGQAVSLLNFLYYNSSSIYNQTIDILTQLSLVGSNVTANYISLASSLTAIDSSLLANFTSVSADLTLINSNLLSNFTTVTATLSAIGTNITANYLSLAATLAAIDSDLLANFTSISAELILIDSNLFSNFTAITATLSAIGSNITTNQLTLLTQLLSVNSTIHAQVLSVLTYAINTNTAVNLVLDPDTFHVLFGDFSFSDDFSHFYGMSNWHNATVTIYENDIQMVAPFSELVVPVLYALSTSPGTYNVSAKFVSGANIAWYNTSYTIAEVIAFKLSEWQVDLELGGQQPYVTFFILTSWENSTVRVYDNSTLQLLLTESEGGINSYFWMSQSIGTHNIVFNITNGVTIVTKTISYYVPDWAVQGLAFTYALSNYQENGTSIFLRSNWGNCTFSFYLNGTLKAITGDDPGQAFFTRPTNVGTWNLTIVCNGGAQTATIKNIYFTVTEEGTTYISGGFSEINYNYEGDSNTYEEDPEKFVTFVMATVSLVFLSIFIGGIVMWWENRKEKKRDWRATVSGGQ